MNFFIDYITEFYEFLLKVFDYKNNKAFLNLLIFLISTYIITKVIKNIANGNVARVISIIFEKYMEKNYKKVLLLGIFSLKEDNEKLKEESQKESEEKLIKNLTGGYTPNITRFPGGSPTAGNLKNTIIQKL